MNVHNGQWEVSGAEGTVEAAVTLKLEDPFQNHTLLGSLCDRR